jgi:4-carboxymuconolactone decarboxylase
MATNTKMQTDPNSVVKDFASGNRPVIEGMVEFQMQNIENSGLDPKTHAMVRLAALVSEGASRGSYALELPVAAESGVTREDVAGLLVALAPTVGAARIIEGAAKIAGGLDIDYRVAEAKQSGAAKMK